MLLLRPQAEASDPVDSASLRIPTSGSKPPFTFITPMGFKHPKTRTYVRLLGPCFKTGQIRLFRQDRELADRRQIL